MFARTDYLVARKRALRMLLIAAKDAGGEGRPFSAQTTDGDRNYVFSMCSPTRAALDSGRAPSRYGINGAIVVETDGSIVVREPYTPKVPFEGEHVRIDESGNWSVNENGQLKHIFPRLWSVNATMVTGIP